MMLTLWMTSLSSQATTYTQVSEYSAGSGANSATISVDFDAGNAFLFTYSWDGAANSFDALFALNSSALDVFYSTDPTWGNFVYDFAYPGGVIYDYGVGANTGWAFYTGTDNENWTASLLGVDDRILSDGDYDSWVWTNYSPDWYVAYREPGGVPIPEPATVALLTLGGLMLRRKKRV